MQITRPKGFTLLGSLGTLSTCSTYVPDIMAFYVPAVPAATRRRDPGLSKKVAHLESRASDSVGKLFFNKKLGEIFRCKCRMCEVRVENSMATAWLYFTSLSDNDLPNLAWFIQSRYGMNPNFSTVHFYESNGFIRNLSLRSSQRHRIMQRK